ncbi:Uncharacterized protein C18B11.03c [Hypsizygus marmoreus]|uniref:Uncharacterized protein C18B11.03c n=1 Tax=Hypsizygus marmoreus TaxID=39966 RepID=A0A369JSZ1_HYPMA|nr:Uncharacterized protein C18B11.03c [Hypsizygus marmoreus]
MGKEGDVLRPAGLLERYHITRHFLRQDTCVTNAAHYTSPEGSTLDKPTMFNALRRVVEAHAALGVRLIDEETRPTFVRLTHVNLDEIVLFCNNDNLAAVLEEQFLQPFDTASNLPLWRIVVLQNRIVLFAWHHCIGDGLSGLAFQRALLASLRQGSSDGASSDSPIIRISPTTTFVPPIEQVTSLKASWRKIFQEFYALVAPVSWTPGASAWTGNVVRKEATFKNHVRLLEFSPEEVSKLLILCRPKQATLTSLVYILAISVLSTLISPENGSAKTISSFIPINLRDVAGTSPNVFCDHVSALHSYTPIQSSFSWADASEFASILRVQNVESREEIGMLKYLFGRYSAYLEEKLGKKRQGGFELSNLGRFNAGESKTGDRWSIGKVVWAQGDATTGAAIKLNVVGDALGGVAMSVTWGDGAIADNLAESFVSNFDDALRNLLTSHVHDTPSS